MSKDNSAQEFWNQAGIAGLTLGLTSTAYMVLSNLLSGAGASTGAGAAFGKAALSTVLWAAKFALCIWLMYYFMKKFAVHNPDCRRPLVFRFGAITAIASALVFSGLNMVYLLYINPESISEAFDTITEAYSGTFNSEAMDALENMKGSFPTIAFFSNFIYCSLFGTFLSSVFAGRLRSNNPFENTDQQ